VTAEAAARAVLAIFEKGELERIDELIDEAYVDHHGPGGQELHGRDGFRRAVEMLRAEGPVELEVEGLLATDDRAAVRVVWRRGGQARHTIELFRFTDGRLVERWGAELPEG
jgi:predicted SnoaL-like aldol condensation-catalyzing enzyme